MSASAWMVCSRVSEARNFEARAVQAAVVMADTGEPDADACRAMMGIRAIRHWRRSELEWLGAIVALIVWMREPIS